jgi:hypothetical protein
MPPARYVDIVGGIQSTGDRHFDALAIIATLDDAR